MPPNRYASLIEAIFRAKFVRGQRHADFQSQDIIDFASKLSIELPRNPPDVIYSFRYRTGLPSSILAEAPEGEEWIIRPAGRGRYRFALVSAIPLTPNANLAITKVPDATPGIISKYAFSDEQAILARLRYNRLVDVFLGIACYSLQNHLRTTVPTMGQVETDEIYIGLDKSGSHYVAPVQAKSRNDRLSRVQVEQDIALCAHRFPSLICRPIGTVLLNEDLIALMEFEQDGDDIRVASEKHYRLVRPDDVTEQDLVRYQQQIRTG